MEVTGHKYQGQSRRAFLTGVSGATLLLTGFPVAKLSFAKPRRSLADPRAVVSYLSSALANGNPADAMSVFRKDFRDYDQLAQQLDGLTQSYDLTSEVEITDATQTEQTAQLTANWTLTRQAKNNGESLRRTQEVQLEFRKDTDGNWRIVRFQGLGLFS